MQTNFLHLRSLFCAAAIAAGTLAFSAPAQAGIVSHPASIVDHGSYITDTSTNLDWYKFSNSINTIGQSVSGWQAATGLSGWTMSSALQVQALQAQFGSVGDTVNMSANANFGLTTAMVNFLGYTGKFTLEDADNMPYEVTLIQALTSDSEVYADPVTNFGHIWHQQTAVETYSAQNGTVLWGDMVKLDDAWQYIDNKSGFTGIWLSRASAHVDVDCGRLAPCLPTDVPEPGSIALVMLGLGVLAARRRKRGAAQA